MRTGLQRFLYLCHTICVLFGRYRGSIIEAINTSSASQDDKDKLLTAVNAIDVACASVDVLRVVWES